MVRVRTAIQRKLMNIIMGTSLTVLGLTCAVFIAYEFFSTSRNLARGLTTRGEIIAANSAAALAFGNDADARQVLSALRADPRMEAAGFGAAINEVAPQLDGRLVRNQFPAAGIFQEHRADLAVGLQTSENVPAGAVEEVGNGAQNFALGALAGARRAE